MTTALVAIIATAASLLGTAGAEMLEAPMHIIGNFFRLTLSHNAGIAFGIRLPVVFQEIVILIALGLITFTARNADQSTSKVGFGLIIGGAIANLIDRFQDGFVTDYIAVGSFPVFNIADSCITIGVGLLILEAFLQRRAH